MRIVHLSDTHNLHKEMDHLPEGDVVIHSGDFSFAGTENEALDFIGWFMSLPFEYKIFIAGNHDNFLFDANIEGMPENCFYLSNSGIEIEGIKFYGVPMFMEDIMYESYDEQIKNIPPDTDILITHQPPYGILDFSDDIHFGSKVLLDVVSDICPQYHLFGHIHPAYGIREHKETIFSNASVVDKNYELKNRPFVFDIKENILI